MGAAQACAVVRLAWCRGWCLPAVKWCKSNVECLAYKKVKICGMLYSRPLEFASLKTVFAQAQQYATSDAETTA
jgi:hypothetical protein